MVTSFTIVLTSKKKNKKQKQKQKQDLFSFVVVILYFFLNWYSCAWHSFFNFLSLRSKRSVYVWIYSLGWRHYNSQRMLFFFLIYLNDVFALFRFITPVNDLYFSLPCFYIKNLAATDVCVNLSSYSDTTFRPWS